MQDGNGREIVVKAMPLAFWDAVEELAKHPENPGEGTLHAEMDNVKDVTEEFADSSNGNLVMSTVVDQSEVRIEFAEAGQYNLVLTISDLPLADGIAKEWSFTTPRLSSALEKAAEMILKMDAGY